MADLLKKLKERAKEVSEVTESQKLTIKSFVVAEHSEYGKFVRIVTADNEQYDFTTRAVDSKIASYLENSVSTERMVDVILTVAEYEDKVAVRKLVLADAKPVLALVAGTVSIDSL